MRSKKKAEYFIFSVGCLLLFLAGYARYDYLIGLGINSGKQLWIDRTAEDITELDRWISALLYILIFSSVTIMVMKTVTNKRYVKLTLFSILSYLLLMSVFLITGLIFNNSGLILTFQRMNNLYCSPFPLITLFILQKVFYSER